MIDDGCYAFGEEGRLYCNYVTDYEWSVDVNKIIVRLVNCGANVYQSLK